MKHQKHKHFIDTAHPSIGAFESPQPSKPSMSIDFDHITPHISFSEEQLDAAIAEVDFEADLSITEQRHVAATVLLGFSYAAALQEPTDLEEALASLKWPQTASERAFAEAMADALYKDLKAALASNDQVESFVARRARILVTRFSEEWA